MVCRNLSLNCPLGLNLRVFSQFFIYNFSISTLKKLLQSGEEIEQRQAHIQQLVLFLTVPRSYHFTVPHDNPHKKTQVFYFGCFVLKFALVSVQMDKIQALNTVFMTVIKS